MQHGWGPGAQECSSFQKLEQARKWIFPSKLQKEHSPAYTLILAQWDPVSFWALEL